MSLAGTSPGAFSAPSGTDNPVAARFKDALRDSYRLVAASAEAGAVTDPVPLSMSTIANSILTSTDPKVTVRDSVRRHHAPAASGRRDR